MNVDTGWQRSNSFEKSLDNWGVNIDELPPVTVSWMEFLFSMGEVMVRAIDDVMYVRPVAGGPVGSFFLPRGPKV